MASIAETSVKPTTIPSSSVIGMDVPSPDRRGRHRLVVPVGRLTASFFRATPPRAGYARHQIRQRFRPEGLHSLRTVLVVRCGRHDGPAKSQLLGLPEPLRRMRDGPHGARKAYFAEIDT